MNLVMRRGFALAALVGLVFVSFSGSVQAAKPGKTIAQLATESPQFSTLVLALQKTGLVPALNGNRMFTVFAPNNEAFDDAAEVLLGAGATGPQLVMALDVPRLTNVLLYHVAPGERFSGDVLSASKIRTVSRGFIGVDGTTLKGVGSEAPLVLSGVDVDASNGVIHEIGFVLLPFKL